MKKSLLLKTSAIIITLLLTAVLTVPAFADEDKFTATFAVSGGEATITVYDTQDYSNGYTSDTAVARDSDTGEIDVSGSGQINFTVVPADGYETADITVEGGYKNLKGPSDTALDNTYRITKVTSDLTVNITLEQSDDKSADESGSPVITFSDDAATVTGSEAGVSVDGTDVKITGAGTYTFTGNCSDGTITVKKNVTGVTLILDNLTLGASATAPITCNKGSGVTIYAAENSVNNLFDDQYNNDDTYTDESLYPDIENAVIKCKDGSNVTICGAGTINIAAKGKNGIKGGADLFEEIENEDGTTTVTDTLLSEASLTIKDVTVNITEAVNDGIKSDKVLNILSGNITVNATDDGIKSDYVLNIGEKGAEGPEINVANACEGIEGATVNIYSGTIKVSATDDGINAANSDLTGYSYSYNQSGGYVYINVTNGDGIDSNGTINITGGTLEIYTPSQGDGDPIDSDGGTTISNATVLGVGNCAMPQSISGTYVAFGSNAGQGGMAGRQFINNKSGTVLVSVGSAITVKDSSGNVLYTGKAVRDASYVIFASPELKSNESCVLYADDKQVATAAAGTSQGGGAAPGMPSGEQPSAPSGNMPEPPSGERPEKPSGEQPALPSGEQPSAPSGDSQTASETEASETDTQGDEEENLFLRILHWIIDFFSNLFT